MFSRIAVVNRGEPALRLIRAVRELNAEHGSAIRVIALHTEAERRATFVRAADEAVAAPATPGRAAPTSTTPSWAARCARAAPTPPGSAGASSPRTRRSPSCAPRSASCSSARRRRRCACSAPRSRPSCSPSRPACRSRRGAAVPSADVEDGRRHAGHDRLPAHRQVPQRRRRARHPHRARPRHELDEALERTQSEARAHLRRPGRLHGAPGRGRPARRGAGHRRPARRRLGAGRARLLGAAAQPEAHRGVELAGADARSRTPACARRRSRW